MICPLVLNLIGCVCIEHPSSYKGQDHIDRLYNLQLCAHVTDRSFDCSFIVNGDGISPVDRDRNGGTFPRSKAFSRTQSQKERHLDGIDN
jgi:hypothetical protein